MHICNSPNYSGNVQKEIGLNTKSVPTVKAANGGSTKDLVKQDVKIYSQNNFVL